MNKKWLSTDQHDGDNRSLLSIFYTVHPLAGHCFKLFFIGQHGHRMSISLSVSCPLCPLDIKNKSVDLENHLLSIGSGVSNKMDTMDIGHVNGHIYSTAASNLQTVIKIHEYNKLPNSDEISYLITDVIW